MFKSMCDRRITETSFNRCGVDSAWLFAAYIAVLIANFIAC